MVGPSVSVRPVSFATREPTSLADGARRPTGRLGVLTVGLGAVASTLIAGVELVKRGLAEPIGSLALMDTIRLGKRTDDRSPLIRDFVPIAALDDLVFGAWDPFPDDAYVAAQRAGVLDAGKHVEQISDALRDVRPMPAAFDRRYVKNIDADNVLGPVSKRAMLEAIREDINRFRDEKRVDRVVMIWCASTEVYIEPGPAHARPRGLRGGDRRRRPDDRAVNALRVRRLAGGRAVLQRRPEPDRRHPRAARLRHRARPGDLGQGLQDRPDADQDGAGADAQGADARPVRVVLDEHPRQPRRRGARRPGELQDEGGVEARRARAHPQARALPRAVRRHLPQGADQLLPARGDNKEGWDNIDIFGWLGYPMQIKVDFLCRDSILAAPLALDLVLFTDLAQRAGLGGIQEWLSFYYKSPMAAPGLLAEDDLFIQLTKLKNTLRWIMGEDQITHLGREYYA